MKPIFYVCCQEKYCVENRELEWCFGWSPEIPQLGTRVSMGTEARWSIVKITTYHAETAHEVDRVYIVHVHPVGLPVPPESEWDRELEPCSFSAEVVLIGQEAIELSLMRGIDTPEIGEQLESIIEPTTEGTVLLEARKCWTRRLIVSYRPVEELRMVTPEETSFARAFLGWWEPTETVA